MTTKSNDHFALLKRVEEELHLADYLLDSTLTLTGDMKVLLGVLQHLHGAQEQLLAVLLDYAHIQANTFTQKIIGLQQFNEHARMLSKKEFSVLQHIQDLYLEQKSCPVEFTRKERVVLCDVDYGMKMIRPEQLKSYKQTLRSLYKKVQLVVGYS